MVKKIFFSVLLAAVSTAGEPARNLPDMPDGSRGGRGATPGIARFSRGGRALACEADGPEILKINADKLVYLEKGNIAEFKKNVKFSKKGFRGNSEYLRFDKKKRKIAAIGKVYIILESTTARKVELWTEKISYTEKDDKISSPASSRFLVFTSTSPGKSGVYEITCDSFYGFTDSRRFYLSGKPVIINGEDLKGMSDFVDFSNDVIYMRGNASLDHAEEKPYQVLAEFIRIDTVRDLVSFKKDVEGTFYELKQGK